MTPMLTIVKPWKANSADMQCRTLGDTEIVVAKLQFSTDDGPMWRWWAAFPNAPHTLTEGQGTLSHDAMAACNLALEQMYRQLRQEHGLQITLDSIWRGSDRGRRHGLRYTNTMHPHPAATILDQGSWTQGGLPFYFEVCAPSGDRYATGRTRSLGAAQDQCLELLKQHRVKHPEQYE